MITCVLQGGLGNQMFQIAATVGAAVPRKIPFAFDPGTWPEKGGATSEVFQANNPEKYLTSVFSRLPFMELLPHLNGYDIYRETQYHYKPLTDSKEVILIGYFQSEKYFSHVSETIIKIFKPDQSIVANFNKKYRTDNKPIVGIHVRRGSHLKNPHYHGSCTADYFLQAIKQFDSNCKYLIFSDDMNWCRNVFKGKNFIFSDNSEDFLDFYDLSLCDHNIICNSTFSWWAAWLNENKNKKIISPTKWYGPGNSHFQLHDLIPEGWIKLQNNLEGE